MNQELRMPSMGEGVHEATVVRWLKQLKGLVKKDDPILEVSTDKVDTEIVAPRDGYLIACFANAGEVIRVDQVIGQIADSPDAPVIEIKLTAHKPQSTKPNNPTTARSAPGEPRSRSTRLEGAPLLGAPEKQLAGFVRSSPLVRKLSREWGVDLRNVRGSGAHGRINKDDLLDYIEHGDSRIPQQAQPNAPERQHFPEGLKVRRESMSHIRLKTAEHMVKSVRISPHVTTTFEIDLERISAFKKQETTLKLTFTAFFIEAALHALRAHPIVNASIDGEDVLFWEEIHIGCAVASEAGLIVPVLKGLGPDTGLKDIARKLEDLVTRTRSKKLTPQDVQGGTFTITNPGLYGSLHSQPIISQPQVAIMSVGAIVRRPVVVGEEILIRPMCQVGLTFDHRLIDGEGGAKFLKSVKDFLEGYPVKTVG